MPRPSYLRRIAGREAGPEVLSPPRILFRPSAGALEVTTALEKEIAATAPAEARDGEGGTNSEHVPLPPAPRPRHDAVVPTPQALAQTPPAHGPIESGVGKRPQPGRAERTTSVGQDPPASGTDGPRDGRRRGQTAIVPVGPRTRLVADHFGEGMRRSASALAVGRDAGPTVARPSDVPPAPVSRSGAATAAPSVATDAVPTVLHRAGARSAPVAADDVHARPGSRPVAADDDVAPRPRSRPVADADDDTRPRSRPVVAADRDAARTPAHGGDRRQAVPHGQSPIRLEPPAVAARPRRPAGGEAAAGVWIGTLDVRIMPGTAVQAPAVRPTGAPAPPARQAPQAPPPASLSRGFRSFGLVQG